MYTLIAVSAFGLEKVVKTELVRMGYKIKSVENGAISFQGELEDIAILNLNLRCAERVYLMVGEFKALSFEALFESIKALPWHQYLNVDSAFPVNAKSVKSQLYSLSDIQKITKKAIVEKLKIHYRTNWFKESAETVDIKISIFKDKVQVLLDTSGVGLHKRGYREQGNAAPLKETLAAALILLSNWRGDRPLIDPMCGTGTLLIEAALIQRNIAPGLGQKFASEKWSFMPVDAYKNARKKAYQAIDYDKELNIQGSDISAKTIAIAKQNAELAGVDDCIDFTVQDIKDWQPKGDDLCIVINPPYGERLEDADKAYQLYKTLGQKINPAWSCFILTSHEKFEEAFTRKSDRNRKLYNGRIKCYFYQYLGDDKKRRGVTREKHKK